VTVPLFGGGRARGGMISAQAGVAESRTMLEQTTELADAAARDAKLELAASEAQWASTSGTVDQAQKAYDIADVRFREGVSTQSELADARLLLQQALANRALAARDLQVARIRSALLPALPVQAAF
jgi:outer membrane protein TolC